MTTVALIRDTIARAKARTGCAGLGMTVKQGRCDIVRVDYDARGRGAKTVLRADLAMPDALKVLDGFTPADVVLS